jgi:hypothetical protein
VLKKEEDSEVLGSEHRPDGVTIYPFPAMIDEVNDILDYAPSKGGMIIVSDCWICTNALQQ